MDIIQTIAIFELLFRDKEMSYEDFYEKYNQETLEEQSINEEENNE